MSSEETINSDKIVSAVLFERLPLVVPKINPTYYAFQQFSFRWGKMGTAKKKKEEEEEKKQPDVQMEKLELLSKGDYEFEYKRVPWTGNADESNNRSRTGDVNGHLRFTFLVKLLNDVTKLREKMGAREPWCFCLDETRSMGYEGEESLFRALDKRLYLLLYGCPPGCPSEKPIWHFPEKVYESEKTLRQCAELALKSVIGDISHACFVANAPMAHMVMQHKESIHNAVALKRFFFKSHVVGLNKFEVENCENHVWVTKDELVDYFPEQADFLRKMIIS